jgi:arylformamidase
LIRPCDLDIAAVGARRLLLKTRSGALWDDPTFHHDFVALAPDAADWLLAHDVLLVGIDYLSIDPYDADPYTVHLTLLGADVVILEGLDLRQVPPGEYDLAALPLKLDGADGAPARVILRSLDGEPSPSSPSPSPLSTSSLSPTPLSPSHGS